MNFYFCETCGKRLTDKELEQGLGRDKKLKGVYCQQCAVGVMTIEFAAIKDVSSANASPAAPLAPTTLAVSKRGSGRNIAAAAPSTVGKEPTQLHATSKSSRTAQQQTMPVMAIVGGIAVVGVLGVVMLIASSGGRAGPARKANAEMKFAAPLPPTQIVPVPNAAPIDASQTRKPVTAPAISESEKLAEESFDKLIRFEGIAQEDKRARIAAVEDFLKSNGETMAGARARVLLADFNSDTQSPVRTPDPTPDISLPKPSPAGRVEEPARAPSVPEPAGAQKAYADFSTDFMGLLCKGDTTAAADRLAEAEKDPALKPSLNELSMDRKVLKWLEEIHGLETSGLKKLETMDRFELRKTNGAPVIVGKREAFQILAVDEKRITFGNQNASLSIALDELNPQTHAAITRLGMGQDVHGLLLAAVADVLAVATPATGDKSAPAVAMARESVRKAQAAGAAASEIQYLSQKLEAIDKTAREALGERAWDKAAALCKEKKWKSAQQAVLELSKTYGDTDAARRRQKEIEALSAEIDDGISQTEGFVFDFKTPDGCERFNKFLVPTVKKDMEVKSDTGKSVFQRVNGASWGGAHLQAASVKYGKNWDMRMKVNFHIAENDISKVLKLSCCLLRFLEPGDKATALVDSGRRLRIMLTSGAGGRIWVDWGREIDLSFKGVNCVRGTGSLSMTKDGKFRGPASTDGAYTLKVSMRQNSFKVEIDSVVIAEYQLPPEAVSLISESPVAIYFGVRDQASQIDLEEFQFVSKDK